MSPDQAGLQLEILSQKRGRGGGVAREMIQSVKCLRDLSLSPRTYLFEGRHAIFHSQSHAKEVWTHKALGDLHPPPPAILSSLT
jgi:hypothetical protein